MQQYTLITNTSSNTQTELEPVF